MADKRGRERGNSLLSTNGNGVVENEEVLNFLQKINVP